MHAQISRWGNSLAVRIPKSLADSLGLHEGSEIDISAGADALTLRKQEPTLEEMVKGITSDNVHGEFVYGPAVGKEAW